ncbi:unnamed protein product [Allacma fusca]|uniref:Peptidase S1 domain-containing protein n=1 Tax=Allacma fusca TaxID=39272 RepID=A0A8J2JQI8_9HEXA|nr:unnamed protein product [Allacma fusca]
MKIFVVAFLSAWVFTAFSDPTPKGASHRRSPEGRKTKEAGPLIVGAEGMEQVSGIDAAILHPNYDSRTMDYDYGVLRLSRLGGCLGDSGGPLVCNGSLTGILSWGEFGCDEGQLPTVFASVAAGRAWLDSQI